MRSSYLVAVVLALIACASIACAEPAMPGFSGLLMAPTTDALGRGQYNFGMTTDEIGSWSDRAYFGNVGVRDGLEVGVLWLHPNWGRTETLLNAKYELQPARVGKASLAIGVSDITDEWNTAVYFVASRDVGKPIRVIGGQPVTLLRLTGGIADGWIDGFFFGAEARLARNLTVLAENVSNEVNLGARLHLWRNFAVDVGFMGAANWAGTISYNYPLQGASTLRTMLPE